MNVSSYNDDMNITQTIFNIPLSRKMTFIFLITLIFPSILGSCFVFSRLIRKKEILKRLNNQLIFCLFLVYFIQATFDLPLTIIFLYHDEVAIPNDTFCIYWFSLISTLNLCCMHLNTYLSIERYLLIFHNNFLLKYKILLHYIPMIFIVSHAFVLVCFLALFYPCQNQFSYHSVACGTACYVLNPTTGTSLWIYSFIAPLFIIIVSNAFLIVRVILQKRRMLQKNIWQKNKRMVLQLVSVTGMLYISWLPISISTVVSFIHSTPLLRELQGNWLLIGLIYIAVLCSPLTTIIAIPELRDDIKVWFNQWRPRPIVTRIHPLVPTGI